MDVWNMKGTMSSVPNGVVQHPDAVMPHGTGAAISGAFMNMTWRFGAAAAGSMDDMVTSQVGGGSSARPGTFIRHQSTPIRIPINLPPWRRSPRRATRRRCRNTGTTVPILPVTTPTCHSAASIGALCQRLRREHGGEASAGDSGKHDREVLWQR